MNLIESQHLGSNVVVLIIQMDNGSLSSDLHDLERCSCRSRNSGTISMKETTVLS